MKHILLRTAVFHDKVKTNQEPEGFIYDSKIGAWKGDKGFLVNQSDFKALGTKKNDVETGEDHKGH